MSARDPDDLLRDGGGEIGDLYRRLPRHEPPRRLDRAVLNEAARAVHSGKPPRRQRWIVGIGSAAGLVLAAGLAWRIGHEPVNTNDAVAPTAAPQVVPVKPIDASARARHDEPVRQQATQSAAAAPPPAEQRAADAVSSDRQKAARKQRAEAKPAPTPMQAEAPPPPAAAPPPQPFSANEQALDTSSDAEKSELSNAGAAANSAGGLKTQPVTSTNMRRASPTPPSSSVELQRDMQLAPNEWLAHIRDLMQQDRRQQATESLRLFVQMHPGQRVPADLRELLE